MKKYLIVLAAALVTFVSCQQKPVDPKPETDKYTSIKFKQTEMTLSIAEQQRLTLLWEPVEIEAAPEVVWATSDSTVATVKDGVITGVAGGEANITATHGELKAVCKVSVVEELDKIKWGGWALWKLNKTDYQSDELYDVEVSVGTVRCRIITGEFQIWDDQFVQETDDDGNFTGLSGAGYRMYITNVPVYIIAEGQYAGYYISYSALQITDDPNYSTADTAFIYCAPAGKQGDAQKFYTYLTDTTATIDYSDCFTGVEVDYVDYDEQVGYWWQGLGSNGIYAGDEWEAYYKCYIDWMGGFYGLALNEDETDFKKPAEWAPITEKYYENLPEAEEVKGLGTPKLFKEPKAKDIKMMRKPTNVLINK